VVLQHLHQRRQLGAGPHLATRIGGRVHNHRFRVLRDSLLDCRSVKGRLRPPERDVPNRSARHLQDVAVVAVERLEENHLVPLLQKGEGRRDEDPGRPHAHNDLLRRRGGDRVVGLFLLQDGPSQRLDARVVRIDRLVLANGLMRPVFDGLGRWEVTDPLPQIDAPDCFYLLGHGANVTLLQRGGPRGNGGRRR
jgi:hypothetical protein